MVYFAPELCLQFRILPQVTYFVTNSALAQFRVLFPNPVASGYNFRLRIFQFRIPVPCVIPLMQ